ncbi:MAG: hypothetical protein AAF988_03055 [Pseudomonadota bacterium]
MKKSFAKNIISLSLVSVFGVGALYLNQAKAQDDIDVIKPSSSWAVTKVAQGQTDPYCTLVRQYEGGSVLTLGQNLNEEYSLAIDFQKPKFDPEKSYSVNLQPGPGQLRAYELIPASPGAMVVRLGWDDSFLSALTNSQMLKVDIDDDNFNFSFPDFGAGENDLSGCMASLKEGKSETVVAEIEPPPAAELPKPQKLEEPIQLSEAETPKAQPPARIIPKVDDQPKETVADAKPDNTQEMSRLASSLQSAQTEITRLKNTLDAEKQKQQSLQQTISSLQSEKNAKASQESTAMAAEIASLTKDMTMITSENEALKLSLEAEKQKLTSIQKQNETQSSLSETQQSETAKLKQDLALALDEKNKMMAELLTAKAQLAEKQSNSETVSSEQASLAAELATVKESIVEKDAKIADLMAAQAEIQSQMSAENASENEKITTLETELETIKKTVSLKDKEIADLMAAKSEQSAQAETESVQKVAGLEKRIAELETENKKFFEDAKRMQADFDFRRIETESSALKDLEQAEDKLEAAMSDNIALTKQVEELTRQQDAIASGISNSDWNLEKATRRYNEAEKEIRRLGALLEQQRSSFRVEEKELERMLFDPAVADREQRKRLSDLETELAEARRALRQAELSRNVSSSVKTPTIYESPMPSVRPEPVEVVKAPPVTTSAPRVSERPSPEPMAKPTPVMQAQPKPAVQSANVGLGDIQSIISRSGIAAGRVTSAGVNNYRWNAGTVSGFAQVTPKTQAGDVVQYAQNYINQQRARCQGDFASVPGNASAGKATYELACVGGNVSTSSSLVIFEKENSVALIAHQTSAEDMDVAMDARDKVAAQIN